MIGSFRSLSKRLPGYLRHNATGQARVRIDGTDHYLGKFGSAESRRKYGELIAKYAGGVPIDPFKQSGQKSGFTIAELVLVFLRHAETHYVKDGKVTAEVDCIKSAIRPLVNWLEHRPIVARPVGSIEKVRKLIRRNPAIFGLAALVLLT